MYINYTYKYKKSFRKYIVKEKKNIKIMKRKKLNHVVESFTSWRDQLNLKPINEAFKSSDMKYFFDEVIDLMLFSKHGTDRYNYIDDKPKFWRKKNTNPKNFQENTGHHHYWTERNRIISKLEDHVSSKLREYKGEESDTWSSKSQVRLSEIPNSATEIIKGAENIKHELLKGKFRGSKKDDYMLFLYDADRSKRKTYSMNIVEIKDYNKDSEFYQKINKLEDELNVSRYALRVFNKRKDADLYLVVPKNNEESIEFIQSYKFKQAVQSYKNYNPDTQDRWGYNEDYKKAFEKAKSHIDYFVDLDGNKQDVELEDLIYNTEGKAEFLGFYSSYVNTRAQYDKDHEWLEDSALTKGGLRRSFDIKYYKNLELFAIDIRKILEEADENPELIMTKDEVETRNTNRNDLLLDRIDPGKKESQKAENVRKDNLLRYREIIASKVKSLTPSDLHFSVLEQVLTDLDTSYNLDTIDFIEESNLYREKGKRYTFKVKITDNLLKLRGVSDMNIWIDIKETLSNNLVPISVLIKEMRTYGEKEIAKYTYHIKSGKITQTWSIQ